MALCSTIFPSLPIAVSSVSLNGESDLLVDLNDVRIVLEAKITDSQGKILDTLWDQVPKYLLSVLDLIKFDVHKVLNVDDLYCQHHLRLLL